MWDVLVNLVDFASESSEFSQLFENAGKGKRTGAPPMHSQECWGALEALPRARAVLPSTAERSPLALAEALGLELALAEVLALAVAFAGQVMSCHITSHRITS